MASSIMHCDLELAQELDGHQKAVRCLTTLKNGFICSGGVDNLVCLFKPIIVEEKVIRYELDKRLHHHTDFVYSVADSPSGDYFYSGGKEKLVYKLDYEGNPHFQYLGHESAVCSIVEQSSERLLTGSWDGCMRIFNSKTGEVLKKVEAGTHAITICLLPTGDIATGSQEASIKIFSSDGENLKHTLNGHSDIIRRLVCNTKSMTLLSCSNDQMIKTWSTDGLEMGCLMGHEGFVFDLCLNDDCTQLYSGADDRLLKVWNLETSSCSQSILHSNTIWGVATIPKTNDVVTACADGIVRIWTTDPTRAAEDGVKEKQRMDATSAAAEASKQGAEIPLDTVPHESEMTRTMGKKKGEIKMFKNNENKIMVYSWNGGVWDLIGEACGRPKVQYGGDQYFPAGEYDYVFEVEMGENGSMVKLPYNEGENQLVVAEKLCARENINKGLLGQITEFLRKQTGTQGGGNKAPTLTQQSGSGSGSAPTTASVPTTNTSSGSSSSSKISKHFPIDDPLFFDTGKPEAAEKKILEFNSELSDDDTEHKMDTIELQHFSEGIKKLMITKGMGMSQDLRQVERDLIWKKCGPGSWSEDKLFPVLDLWRLHLLKPDSCAIFKGTDRGYSYITTVLKLLKSNLSTPLGIGCARFFANIFASFTNRASLFEKRLLALEAFKEIALSGSSIHKQVKLALSTTLMNFSTAFIGLKEKSGRVELIDCCETYITGPLGCGKGEEDYEGVYRILVAIGNLMIDSTVEKTSTLSTTLNAVTTSCNDARCKEAATDILKLIG